jgi:maltooligosyltrehalose synthase
MTLPNNITSVSCQLETCLKDMADMKGMKEEASSLRNTMELLKQELQEAKDIEKKNSDDVNALMREIQILRTYINLDEKDQLESSMDKEDISQLKKALHEVINNWGSPSAKQTTSTSK